MAQRDISPGPDLKAVAAMLIRLCENPDCRQPAAYGAWCMECAATPNRAESALPFIEWNADWDDDTMDCD